MASTLGSILSETDDSKKGGLYKILFQEINKLDDTFQENDFVQNSIDELLSVLLRDTDIINHQQSNKQVIISTLHHIIPVLGYFLNLSQTFEAQSAILCKLCFNALNIIRSTDDLELCIRGLWLFKSIVLPLVSMDSFLSLFYESTFQFLSSDTNRFLSQMRQNNDKQSMEYEQRVCLLHSMILRSYLNLYRNHHHYKILMKKSAEWLHLVVLYLISDQTELQNAAIEFLLSFIAYIKSLDEGQSANCVDYQHYNRYFSSNQRLLKVLKSLIDNPKGDKKTIFKLKTNANNKHAVQQERNIKIWSIIVHALGLNISADQKMINRLLNYIKTYFGSNPLLAFKYFADLIFVFNLNPKRLAKKQTISLCYKVFDSAFSVKNKAKRTLGQQLECLNTWFYILAMLAKHKILFKHDAKGNIPFNILAIPLFHVAVEAQTRAVITRNIIVFMTDLLQMNEKKSIEIKQNTPSPQQNMGEMSPNDTDMKEIEDDDNDQKVKESMADIVDIDQNVTNFEWKFEFWLTSITEIIQFAEHINNAFGDNNVLCNKLSKTMFRTFFKTVIVSKKGTQNERIQTKYFNRYLEEITLFLATNINKKKNRKHAKNIDRIHTNMQSLMHMADLLQIYFQNTAKYESNLRKLKFKPLYDSKMYSINLTQCNKNMTLFLMRLWLAKCESMELFLFSTVYEAFIDRIKVNNEKDVIYALEMYQNVMQNMLCALTKIKMKNNKNNKLNQKRITHLNRVLSYIFRQIFDDIPSFKVMKSLFSTKQQTKEIRDKILSIYRSFTEHLFQFISVCEMKPKIDIDFSMYIVPNIADMICKLLNGSYDETKKEWIQHKEDEDMIFMHKPHLNTFINSISESIKDKHCYDATQTMDLIWIKFAYLWLQFMYKSKQNWYHQMENKAMFEFIMFVFIYIVHQNNHNPSISVSFASEAKHFMESFSTFLSKLSMTHYVNIWCESITTHLTRYIHNKLANDDVIDAIDENAHDVNHSICHCFTTFIHILCHYSDAETKHRSLRSTKHKSKTSENLHFTFIQLLHDILKLNANHGAILIWKKMSDLCIAQKIKHIFKIMSKCLDAKQIKSEYQLLFKIFLAYKDKKEKEELKKKKEKEKIQTTKAAAAQCIRTPIMKPMIVSTRSRRKSNKRKKNECAIYLDDSQHEKLSYSETQLSFDIFDAQYDDNHNDNNNDEKDDIEMKDKTGANIINESDEKEKSKSTSLKSSDLQAEQNSFSLSGSGSIDVNKLKSSKSKSPSLQSTLRSERGNKRKLNEMDLDIKQPKAKKLRIDCNDSDDNKLFFPSLIGYNANINNLLNMLPRKIRRIVDKLPFKTIDELAKCGSDAVRKYILEEKKSEKEKEINVEYEVNEIKNTLQTLVVVYNKEREKRKKEVELKQMSATTSNDTTDSKKCDIVVVEDIEAKLISAKQQFEQRRHEWDLDEISRIHAIIGEFNTKCIECTSNQLKNQNK